MRSLPELLVLWQTKISCYQWLPILVKVRNILIFSWILDVVIKNAYLQINFIVALGPVHVIFTELYTNWNLLQLTLALWTSCYHRHLAIIDTLPLQTKASPPEKCITKWLIQIPVTTVSHSSRNADTFMPHSMTFHLLFLSLQCTHLSTLSKILTCVI